VLDLGEETYLQFFFQIEDFSGAAPHPYRRGICLPGSLPGQGVGGGTRHGKPSIRKKN